MDRRGAVSIGCMLLAAILAVGAYHGYKFGRPYLDKGAFSEDIFALSEHIFRSSRKAVDQRIIEAAAARNIVITPKNITYREGYADAYIQVDYQVPVETFLISRQLTFQVVVTRKFTR